MTFGPVFGLSVSSGVSRSLLDETRVLILRLFYGGVNWIEVI